jgi:hypothetical protein
MCEIFLTGKTTYAYPLSAVIIIIIIIIIMALHPSVGHWPLF